MAKIRLCCELRPFIHDLGSRSWHTLGSWTTIVSNITQIQHGGKEFLAQTWVLLTVTLMNNMGQRSCNILESWTVVWNILSRSGRNCGQTNWRTDHLDAPSGPFRPGGIKIWQGHRQTGRLETEWCPYMYIAFQNADDTMKPPSICHECSKQRNTDVCKIYIFVFWWMHADIPSELWHISDCVIWQYSKHL